MPHPLVLQLRFTRKEFQRALKNITPEEATRRIEPMNSISWIIGHMAWQEQLFWLTHPQGLTPAPAAKLMESGQPASVPPLDEMWECWHTVTKAADPWLDALTSADLKTHTLKKDGTPYKESVGSRMHRTIHHYWFHIGESQAIRQMFGHTGLPVFVGDQHEKAPYTPESD